MSGEFMVWESGLFVVVANRSVFKNVFIYLSRYLVGLAAELYSHYTTEYLAKFFCLKYRPTYHNNKQAAVLITQVVLINLTLQVSE